MEQLIYSEKHIVKMATNTFVNIPVILKYEDTPLISIIKDLELGVTTHIPIYHPDGTYLAKTSGTRIYSTKDGVKAGLKIQSLQDTTVCKLGNQTLFEVQHEKNHLFKVRAELYTPTGYLIKCNDVPGEALLRFKGETLQAGGVFMTRCTFSDLSIGIWLKKDGSCLVGVK